MDRIMENTDRKLGQFKVYLAAASISMLRKAWIDTREVQESQPLTRGGSYGFQGCYVPAPGSQFF